VVHVHALHEAAPAMEPRMVRFAPAQREPADSAAEAESKAHAEPGAEESDERRTVERSRVDRTRRAAPPAVDEDPAAIVVRRKAPGRVVNPRPAPRANPSPVTRAVRRPAGIHGVRIPHMAVVRFLVPGAVLVEVGVTGRVTVHILPGNGVVFFQVAFAGPAIQAILTRRFVHGVLNVGVLADEFAALAGMNFIGLAARGHFAFAA